MFVAVDGCFKDDQSRGLSRDRRSPQQAFGKAGTSRKPWLRGDHGSCCCGWGLQGALPFVSPLRMEIVGSVALKRFAVAMLSRAVGMTSGITRDVASQWHFMTSLAELLLSFLLCYSAAGCWTVPSTSNCLNDLNAFFVPGVNEAELLEIPDVDCMGPAPDLQELILPKPSLERPFVFLWDEKTGGTTFNDWLLASAANHGLLNSTHISDFGWPNVIGTPFFLKTYDTPKLQSLQVLSATVDWNIFSLLGCSAQRRPSCLVLLRNPIDRFLSYYLERSERRLEGGAVPIRRLMDLSMEEFEAYLESIQVDQLRFNGKETGVFCNRENANLCLSTEGLETEEAATETFAFRRVAEICSRLKERYTAYG